MQISWLDRTSGGREAGSSSLPIPTMKDGFLIFAFMISFGNINNILATSATDGKDYDSKEVKDNVRH